MKFTDISIKSLKPKEKKYYVRATMGAGKHGFALCVYPSGIRSWFFIYTFEGKRHSLALGNYPDMGIASANQKFDEYWNILKDGKNPATVIEEKQEKRRMAHTVNELIAEYLERHAMRFKRSHAEDERILKKDVVPVLGKKKAVDITKRDINLLLEDIVDRGAPVMANNTFKVIRKMLNYAVEKDILPYSPAAGIKLPSPTVDRDRTLSEAEIKVLWLSLDTAAMSDESRRALKLILVTAQRPGEVSGMQVSEIDGSWWTIPAERSKNKLSQRVYLTDLAQSLIREGRHGFVFPSPHKEKDAPMFRHALSRAVVNNCPTGCVNDCVKCTDKECLKDRSTLSEKNKLGIPHFTPHDLRRTAATFMAQMGAMDEVIDAVLNHSKQGVIKVYNQYRYDKEKQTIWEAWAVKLTGIINTSENGTDDQAGHGVTRVTPRTRKIHRL